MDKLSYLSNADGDYIEQLYKSYLNEPSSVDPGWQKFFEGFEFAKKNFGPESDKLTVPGEFKVINQIGRAHV